MKKILILTAIAALAASAACTKVETITPDQAISFEVAKYMPLTRAYNSLLDETAAGSDIDRFFTNAWYHDGAAGFGAQRFMTDQAIVPDNASDPTKWSPSGRNYFWPKTGSINFFSYAGSPVPTAKAEGSITYSGVTVNNNSNILVADGAYGYSSNTTSSDNDTAAGTTGAFGQNSVTRGVPTLFHHMLAKVKFDVILDATEDADGTALSDTKDKWMVSITSAALSVPTVGTLAVTFSAPASTPDVAPYSTTGWTSLGTYSSTGFSMVTGNGAHVADPENYETDNAITLVAVGGTQSVSQNRTGYQAAGTAQELIALGSVIPHAISTNDNVTFAMTYTIAYSYDGGTPIRETITIPATKLTTWAPGVDTWAMNNIYTYHIIIKPNGQILFDPTVETWVPENTVANNIDKQL